MVMNDMTDDGKWGAEIAVDGVRPEWLEDGPQPILLHNAVGWHTFNCDSVDPAKVGWAFSTDGRPNVDTIRLPADHPHYQQTQPIDWSAPIEAVHEDGRTFPVHFVKNDGSVSLPILISPPLEDGVQWFNNDGSCEPDRWRIRNVQPVTQKQPQTLTAQEHLERLEAFVRKAAAHVSPMAQYSAVRDHLGDEARALVAEMEPVVDPDLIEARKVGAECGKESGNLQIIMDPDCWMSGRNDNTHKMQIALAAIKRGRELARGDVA